MVTLDHAIPVFQLFLITQYAVQLPRAIGRNREIHVLSRCAVRYIDNSDAHDSETAFPSIKSRTDGEIFGSHLGRAQ